MILELIVSFLFFSLSVCCSKVVGALAVQGAEVILPRTYVHCKTFPAVGSKMVDMLLQRKDNIMME